MVVTLRKPAAFSQVRYSRNVKTFPSSVCRSMFNPNSTGIAGPVRASFGTYSPMSSFPAGPQRRVGFPQKFLAVLFSFRVDNVAEDHQVILIAPEVRRPQVALEIIVSSGDAEFFGEPSRDRRHLRKIHGRHARLGNGPAQTPATRRLSPRPTSRILWILRRSFFGNRETATVDAAKFPGKMLATNFGKNSLPFSATSTVSAGWPLLTASVRFFQASQVSERA